MPKGHLNSYLVLPTHLPTPQDLARICTGVRGFADRFLTTRTLGPKAVAGRQTAALTTWLPGPSINLRVNLGAGDGIRTRDLYLGKVAFYS